ncbi:NAD(P)-binding protein [Streptomyces alboniger]|uniref:FAD-dependent oxidoreductase n=1 Tax=Streptomyces alboniger TaxID=132473 RepID=A0A5J6H9E1_STRAD|nr:NAD(P)-binding protein [Streptomyces alboniger]QEV16649.1 FAD-dependent oxidoreductase [Streptomyces alboniger]
MAKNQHSSSPGARWERAVVIGGGYAGLVTARVLADHFDEVLVLERDPLRSRRRSPAGPAAGVRSTPRCR